jgi:glutathione-regulated potassium-efflux system ancillary protein KefF
MVFLVFAHPYPDRSRANRRLLAAVEDLAGLEVRSLYDAYPTFDIDVQAEQASLLKADTIVWHHPTYWYSVPGLLKHWFDKVLVRGWAYGDGTAALRGKRCLWVTTTGGDEEAYRPEGMHGRPFSHYSPVVEQTAVFCGMRWLDPIIVQGVNRASLSELDALGQQYRARLARLIAESGPR